MTAVRVRCAAMMANGWQCDRQATWWVQSARARPPRELARCANHAQPYRISWPVRTDNAQRDWVTQRMAMRDAQGGDS